MNSLSLFFTNQRITVMHIIEPCCSNKHLRQLRERIGSDGTEEFMGYGDMSITELLPAMVTYYTQTRLLIAAPSIPDQAAEAIAWVMRRSLARMDGKGNVDVVTRLTIVTDMERSPMVRLWLKDDTFKGRLRVIDVKQEDTAILLPNFAVSGPVNMRYGYEFIATATTNAETIEKLWEKFSRLAEEKPAREDVPRQAAKAKRKKPRRKV